MRNKIYAWVKTETCTIRGAVLPGSRVGRNEEMVSRHGDYLPWLRGKRATLRIIREGCANATNYYRYRCAVAVAELRGWTL